jgi:NAD(P)-dependent dehydrogenase (short-subunit alcohol dehydrogenase family)
MSYPAPKHPGANGEISAVLCRAGQPGEVAAAAAWPCPGHASFITGAAIPIDAGKLAAATAL